MGYVETTPPLYPDRMVTIGQIHHGGLFRGRSINVLPDGRLEVKDEWVFPEWDFARIMDMESEADELRRFKDRGWSRESIEANDRNPYRMLTQDQRRLSGRTGCTGPR